MTLNQARMPGTSGTISTPRKPYGGKYQLCNIVDVKLDNVLQTESFDCGDWIIRPGDTLVVQTARGPSIARAIRLPQRVLIEKSQYQRVIRPATVQDLERDERHKVEAKEAMRQALKCIRALKLDMKLIAIDYMLDRSRALVYFTSENRVDFRQLVRDLARDMRIRIEMRQIGVRDGAGIIGGIGPCGHELCCSSFLRTFQNVSVRAPKLQGITLNPQRITGMCGRLKCCLVYETAAYEAARPFAPRRDRSVLTVDGPASIMSVDALSRTLMVRFPGGSSATVHLRDVIVLDHELTDEELRATMTREEEVMARRRQRSGGGRVAEVNFGQSADDFLWDDLEQPPSFFGTELETTQDSSKTRARRASPKANPSERGPEDKPDTASGDGAPKKKSRRRPRRPTSKASGNKAAQGQNAAKAGDKNAPSGDGQNAAPAKRKRTRRPRKKTDKPNHNSSSSSSET